MTLPIVGITMGDPAGIGPEIILKALCLEEPFRSCRPIVFGDQGILAQGADRLGLSVRTEAVESVPQEGYVPQRIFVRSRTHLTAASLHDGRPKAGHGEAMVKYVEEAVRWAQTGKVDALTTCPISKEAVHAAGYPFSGHTELLAHLVQASSVAMMFLSSRWKIVFVTTHLPLREVPQRVTEDRILSVIRMTDDALKRYFAIPRPRIAVLGLNPHCGEGGVLGEEEKREIIPAIAQAGSLGLNVEGPFPADSFFDLSSSRHEFDAVVSMYHDQGLIPIKMLDFQGAVNFTVGLPFVRTSVGHGTAYDIAGRGLADPTNLVKALVAAAELSKSIKKNAGESPGGSC